ncbi:Signal transduction histidine kinase [Paenibacillus sp. UNCCL117]|nr:Signal transduction histidine kinase [Paenibacillus sp. cl123]SFW22422.1 Signal transduction histidine kinase [Paenibacillus sp. UNCCL117]
MTVLGIMAVGFILNQLRLQDDSVKAPCLSAWQRLMTAEASSASLDLAHIKEAGEWVHESVQQRMPHEPAASSSVWVKFQIPSFEARHPMILMNRLYAQSIRIYLADQLVYESIRDHSFDTNNVLLPIKQEDMGQTLYMWLDSPKKQIGLSEGVLFGEDSQLRELLDENIESVIIGSSFVFIAITMLCCSVFLLRTQAASSWLLLTAIVFLVGILFISYSSYTHVHYEKYGYLLTCFFDLALFAILPAVTYFFEKIIGPGYKASIRIWRYIQVGYSLFACVFLIIDRSNPDVYFGIYYFISVTAIGLMATVQFLLLSLSTLFYARKGNRDARIFAFGALLLASSVIGDMANFYMTSGNYELMLWRWGISFFVISLIVIMGRRLADYYEQIINYSKEVELYNNQLQRSDKLEVISELAASIAHEVRNPLQVTRGFLQLLSQKVTEQEKEFMNLAISELDRAADIITDFLTFAKPQMDNFATLHVQHELKQIEGIVIPLARLNGSEVELTIPQHLYIRGNSSKFKQVLINLIKNSIEAMPKPGKIDIWAYEAHQRVSIHIRDTGEGMDASEVARLGEPYFSTKTKGTGLGLMVTFRIIEVMQGTIHFESEKGKGTEVVLTFPALADSA